MKANIVDLRYKMKDVLRALNKRERVEVTYRGRMKGIIIPVHEVNKKSAKDHELFGCLAGEKRTVRKMMDDLRKERYAV